MKISHYIIFRRQWSNMMKLIQFNNSYLINHDLTVAQVLNNGVWDFSAIHSFLNQDTIAAIQAILLPLFPASDEFVWVLLAASC